MATSSGSRSQAGSAATERKQTPRRPFQLTVEKSDELLKQERDVEDFEKNGLPLVDDLQGMELANEFHEQLLKFKDNLKDEPFKDFFEAHRSYLKEFDIQATELKDMGVSYDPDDPRLDFLPLLQLANEVKKLTLPASQHSASVRFSFRICDFVTDRKKDKRAQLLKDVKEDVSKTRALVTKFNAIKENLRSTADTLIDDVRQGQGRALFAALSADQFNALEIDLVQKIQSLNQKAFYQDHEPDKKNQFEDLHLELDEIINAIQGAAKKITPSDDQLTQALKLIFSQLVKKKSLHLLQNANDPAIGIDLPGLVERYRLLVALIHLRSASTSRARVPETFNLHLDDAGFDIFLAGLDEAIKILADPNADPKPIREAIEKVTEAVSMPSRTAFDEVTKASNKIYSDPNVGFRFKWALGVFAIFAVIGLCIFLSVPPDVALHGWNLAKSLIAADAVVGVCVTGIVAKAENTPPPPEAKFVAKLGLFGPRSELYKHPDCPQKAESKIEGPQRDAVRTVI